jgi:hypothetical protein
MNVNVSPILNPVSKPVRTEYKTDREQFLATSSKVACLRPDIFLDSGRTCDRCFHYEYCQCVLRLLTGQPESIRKEAKEAYRLACIREREALRGTNGEEEHFEVADDTGEVPATPEAPEANDAPEETEEETEETFEVTE